MFNGLPYSRVVEFSDGVPDGDVTWVLKDVSGTQIATGTSTPAAQAVSVLIVVPASNNTLGGGDPLRVTRDLSWSYTTGGATRAGAERYFVEGSIPLPVSNEGVRNLLGVPEHNLSDDEIDLIQAYWTIQAEVGATNLAAYENMDSVDSTVISRGIQAQAALEVLPSLALRVSTKETSGTDSFSRGKIDWEALEEHLRSLVSKATSVVSGTDPESTGSIFQLTLPEDRFGAEN